FSPSFRDTHVSLRTGSVDGRLGWVDNDYLSDNQGPILGMIANYKTGIIWNATRKVPNLVCGLKRAGFTGGWLNGRKINHCDSNGTYKDERARCRGSDVSA